MGIASRNIDYALHSDTHSLKEVGFSVDIRVVKCRTRIVKHRNQRKLDIASIIRDGILLTRPK